jgi:hypothetical protein
MTSSYSGLHQPRKSDRTDEMSSVPEIQIFLSQQPGIQKAEPSYGFIDRNGKMVQSGSNLSKNGLSVAASRDLRPASVGVSGMT